MKTKDGSGLEPYGYCDEDYHRCPSTRKYTSGFMFLVSDGSFSWYFQKQVLTTATITEAEYILLAVATQEVVWIGRMLCLATNGSTVPTVVLHADSQAAIKIAKNGSSCFRTMYIDTKFRIARNHLRQEFIYLNYCPTNEMLFDLLTKPLARSLLYRFWENIGPAENYDSGNIWQRWSIGFWGYQV